jgi:hypothetical protein
VSNLRRVLPTTWWSSFLWISLSYVLATNCLPNLLLLLINCAGYLPYSDRPGPGWQPPHIPSKQELEFFFGFTRYLLPSTAIYGGAFGAIGLLFGLCSLPRWAIRAIAVPLCLLASALLMAAAGWMIAISALGVYLAAGCAALWALIVLPNLIVPRDPPLSIFPRVALPCILMAAGGFYLVRPFLPQATIPALDLDFTRCSDTGTAPIVSLDRAWQDDTLVRQAGLADHSCHLESAGQRGESGNGSESVTLHLLFLRETSREVDIPVPSKGEALVIIDGDSVRMLPEGVPLRKERLRVREVASGHGFSMKDDGPGRMDDWFWQDWSPQTG